MNDSINEILAAYNLDVIKVESVTERLKKIQTSSAVFALKESSLSVETLPNWERVYQQAHHLGIHQVLPVCLNKHNQLYTKFQQHVYYLQPWMDISETRTDNARTLQAIAQIHRDTKQEIQLKSVNMNSDFRQYMKFCGECAERLKVYMSLFESNRFMSPFELLVCTQYHQIKIALETIISCLENMIGNNNETMDWTLSLCHGNLLPEHVCCGEGIYLLNWEKAHMDSPVSDLWHYFKSVTYSLTDTDTYLDGLTAYMKINQLDTMQCDMLLIHLLNPNQYLHAIGQYKENGNSVSMISQVQELQRISRTLFFGLSLKQYMDEKQTPVVNPEDNSDPS